MDFQFGYSHIIVTQSHLHSLVCLWECHGRLGQSQRSFSKVKQHLATFSVTSHFCSFLLQRKLDWFHVIDFFFTIFNHATVTSIGLCTVLHAFCSAAFCFFFMCFGMLFLDLFCSKRDARRP